VELPPVCGATQTQEASWPWVTDPVRTAWAPGAAQTIITKAATRISRPAMPVSHVDLARDPLTTADIFAPFPRSDPRSLSTVELAP
jgi:hypothetical protein